MSCNYNLYLQYLYFRVLCVRSLHNENTTYTHIKLPFICTEFMYIYILLIKLLVFSLCNYMSDRILYMYTILLLIIIFKALLSLTQLNLIITLLRAYTKESERDFNNNLFAIIFLFQFESQQKYSTLAFNYNNHHKLVILTLSTITTTKKPKRREKIYVHIFVYIFART